MAKKMTLKDNYLAIREILETVGRNDLVEFIDGRVALVDKKNATGGERKPTATQVLNAGIKEGILAWLPSEGAGVTVGDMLKGCKACEGYSSSKITSLVTQLVKEEKVIRTENKGRALFRKANGAE